MKHAKVLVVATGNGNANRSVLFKPAVQWVTDVCQSSGIEDVVVVDTEKALTQSEAADVLVIDGDMPLMTVETVRRSLELHRAQGNAVTTVGSAVWLDSEQVAVTVPDRVNVSDKKVGHYSAPEDVLRITDCKSLLKITDIARRRIIERHLENGVEFVCTDGVLIADNVQIGRGTVILPGTVLRGNTVIGEECTIGPNTLIEDSVVGDGCTVNACQIYKSTLHDRITMGPFCHIRPNTELCDGVHIGDFVEVKNSVIGEETHIAHLSYVGDSDVGKKVNFGGGVITVNYDGKYKHRTVVGDRAFIGCNSNLVAPVTIGERGFTAAGSTITDEVPAMALGIARARQVNKEGWVNGHEMKE